MKCWITYDPQEMGLDAWDRVVIYQDHTHSWIVDLDWVGLNQLYGHYCPQNWEVAT